MNERNFDPAKALVAADPVRDEARVRQGFLRKLGRVAARVPFAGDAVALYFAARDPATPRKTKGLMLAALSYFVLPADAIPDVFAGVGFTDDAAVIEAVIALAGSAIRPQHKARARELLEALRR
jgi:uncharacterized membrane protein YkvA (DUF1232 family)